jgi:XTP/dITP diphosphohydrolase/ATP diphosphatase
LRNCNLRFRQRFREMERAAPRPLEELSPDELEALWTQAKKKLASQAVSGPDLTAQTISQAQS